MNTAKQIKKLYFSEQALGFFSSGTLNEIVNKIFTVFRTRVILTLCATMRCFFQK